VNRKALRIGGVVRAFSLNARRYPFPADAKADKLFPMSTRTISAVLLACGLVLAAPPSLAKPSAKDVAAAKKSSKEGQKLEKKKAWEDAKAAYEKSLELNDTPSTRIRLAGVEEELGNLVEAAAQLRVALEAKKLSFAQRTKAKKALKKIEKRIPVLTLDVPAGFAGKVSVDDRELTASELSQPINVNPGSHEVRAEAEGSRPFRESIEFADGDTKNLSILLTELEPEKPEPEPEPAPVKKGGDKTLAYVSLGVGVVGLGVGTYMGLKARSTKDELDGACSNGVCSESQRDLYDKGKSQANISTVGFIVGAVGIGAGTVLLLSGGGKEGKVEARHASPYVGPGSVGVAGWF
jgi:hypothetical protein